MSVSHPLAVLPSQSPKPALQVTRQTPAEHDADPLLPSQDRPQPPQLGALVRVSASQPVVGSPSQSANPASQVYRQAVPSQVTVEWARAAHATHDAPQVDSEVLLAQIVPHRW